MANTQQYKRTDARNVVAEATRQLRKYKNNVDRSKSHLNYNLIEGSDTRAQIMQKIDDRVREVMGNNIRKQVKKNMKPLGTWVVTLPQELNGLNDEQKRDFFQTTLDFLGDRYGKENLVYANVHNDESQPHMHVGIVPVCVSRKTGKETVSAASMFTKKDLINFHKDLDKVMENKYGQANLINNGRTKGNYTIEELKERQRAEKELKEREEKVKALEDKVREDRIAIIDERARLRVEKGKLDQREKEVEKREAEAVNKVDMLLSEEKAKLQAQAQQLQAEYVIREKRLKEEYEAKHGQLDAYKERLAEWKDKSAETINNQLSEVKKREIEADKREEEQNGRDEALDARERNLNGKEDRLASREAVILEKAQNASRELVRVNAERAKVEHEKEEAQQLLQQANERLDEVKATESRVQKLLEELRERGSNLVRDIKQTIGRWTSQVRQSPKPNATEYFADRTEKLGEDLQEKQERENFVQLAYEDLNFYNEDMEDALKL